MNATLRITALGAALLTAGLPAAPSAAPTPAERRVSIGYVYPAGGQRGTSVDVRVGGEYVYGATTAIFSGTGVTARIIDSRDPAEGKVVGQKKPRKRNAAVIDEIVRIKVTIAPDAAPGNRDLRVVAPDGVSNPLVFQVSQLNEVREFEPNDKKKMATLVPALPAVLNGQIMPGDADTFRFQVRKGQRLVMETAARTLVPYLADAVPGWFQAVLSLSDAQGQELAYADDYRFSPDPVMLFDVPADGEYRLAIRDSIYRGRADFVYRIRIGELPFITGVFPAGAPRGNMPVSVALTGCNLPAATTVVDVSGSAPRVQAISVSRNGVASSPVSFAVGTGPEVLEDEVATRQSAGQGVVPPVTVNGRIQSPGERDTYRFNGKKGTSVWLSVLARRLGSPLDSCLVLLDRRGAKVGGNDDVKDPSQGLLTHQADSELLATLPEDGVYTVRIYDMQGKGGDDYVYRLSLGPPVPDFELRATPASLSLPAGGSAAFTVHALRRCGFAGEIRLALDAASAPGCSLEGGTIPEGADKASVTLSAPGGSRPGPAAPRLSGTATVAGRPVTRPVVPSEDRMQAFIYQHLVPAEQYGVNVTTSAPFRIATVMGPSGYLALPQGKETTFNVKASRQPGFNGFIKLQLEGPPKGITLRRGGVPPGKETGTVTIRTESKVEGGLAGNLILSGVMMIDPPGATNAPPKPVVAAKPAGTNAPPKAPFVPRERVSVTLPALPFRVIANPERTTADAGKSDQK